MSGLLSVLPPPPPGRLRWPWNEETPPNRYANRTDWPRISIVTPSYQQAAYLEETIRSILLQNYPNLQYIVMDGGSSDGSVKILERYSPWISLWRSESDRGQSHAINKGLDACDGKWFNWLNSDDYLLPGALHALADSMADEGDPLIVAGRLQTLLPDGRTKPCDSLELQRDPAELIVNHHMAQPAMFYRRDLIPGVSEELHLAMDFELWTRFLCAHGHERAREIDTPVAVFRHHAHAKTTQQAAGFEKEERAILRNLFKAMQAPPALQHALSPIARDKTFDLAHAPAFARLAHAVLRRYLLGDLRRIVHAHGWSAGRDLRIACAPSAPVLVHLTAIKAWLKRLLRKPLDA